MPVFDSVDMSTYGMSMLSVSIVIPAFNEHERIMNCLVNATRQSVAPLEVIVVDNRSTDDTCKLVEKFMRAHPRSHVQLLHLHQ